MSADSASHPPVLSESGENYEEWKKLTKYWMKFTKIKKSEQGAFLTVKALKGEARSLALSIPEEQLDADDGVDVLMKELDKLYLKDKDTLGYECWKKFSTYTRAQDSSILSYCAEFRRIRMEAVKYKVEMSDTTFAFMLLDNANLNEDQKVLVLSIALSKVDGEGSISPEHVEAAMKRIEGGSKLSSQATNDVFESEDFGQSIDIQSLSLEEKDEIVEEALYAWQNGNKRNFGRRNQNNGNKQNSTNRYYNNRDRKNNFDLNKKGPMINPKDIQTGEIMKCHGCNSRFHLYRSMQCPKNANINIAEDSFKIDDINTIENIFASEADFKTVYSMNGFGVVDSAATKTVCGKPWFDAFKSYLTSLEKTVDIIPSNVCYKFGNDGIKKSLFAAVIPICFFGRKLLLNVDVISSNCPLLMGRPTLEKLELILNFKNGTAIINGDEKKLKRSEKGHFLISLMFDEKLKNSMQEPLHSLEIYAVDQMNEIYFSEDDIENACEIVYSTIEKSLENCDRTARRLHLVFGHPTSKRLIRTVMMGLKGQDDSKVKALCEAIEKFTNSCQQCINAAQPKPKPKVTLPLACDFNDVLAFDLTFWNDPLHNKTVIIAHFIDLATRLSAASVIPSKDPNLVINALVKSWLNVFGAPSKAFTDNGGEFANAKLTELMEHLGIDFKATAAESSFSNGINERHHAIVKSILNKIRCDHKDTPIDVILSYAIFAKNCLVDNLGFSPHQRVFGRSPNLPSVMSSNPCCMNTEYKSDVIRQHIDLLNETRKAYMTADSSNRIKRALNSRIFTSEAPFYYGEQVYYWKDSVDKKMHGWKGPGTVIGSEGKVVIIRQGSFIQRAHETKVRRCKEDTALEKKDKIEPTKITENIPLLICREDDSNQTCDNLNDESTHIPEMNDENTNIPEMNDESTDTNDKNTHIPEINEIPSSNNDESQDTEQNKSNILLRPRNNIKRASKWGYDEVYEVEQDDEMIDAKVKELNSWKTHEVYKEVDINDAITPLISTRWILSTKERIDKSSYIKARLVIRGFEDVDKDIVQSESPTAHIESVKIMFAILPTIGFRPKKMDISTAFLQGKSLTRPVFIKPPSESNVQKEKCWMLLKGVYGLTDASRMWYERVNEVLVNGNYVRSFVDPALYFKYEDNKVIGIILCHVDDFLYAGSTKEVENIERNIKEHFEVRTIEEKVFMFCVFFVEIIEKENGTFQITYSQPNKIGDILPIEVKLQDPSLHATPRQQTQFRSVLGALQWHSSNTRPDLAFSISSLLGNSKHLLVKHCILANKILRKAKANDPFKINCINLLPTESSNNRLNLNVYTDASFANLPDLGSQRGSMAFIENDQGVRNLIDFTSRRIKRVCRSTFAAELLGCNAAVDLGIYYQDIIKTFGIDPVITIISDSKSVKENLSNIVSRCEEKRLRIELAYLREVMSEKGIRVRWVSSSEQLADILTKEKSGVDILECISSNRTLDN